jgi:septum site-determining protein MinC
MAGHRRISTGRRHGRSVATDDQVELKGMGGGVQAIVPTALADDAVGAALARTLEGAAAFLGRGAVTVVLPGRRLTAALAAAVVAAMERAPDAALSAITTALPRPGTRAPRTPPPHAGHPIVHPHTLRAGQEIRHGGDVVVLGSVHRGARVIAEGNVIVLGRLEGMAHAGALGETDRFIYAGAFAPSQVRIGGHIAAGAATAGERGEDGHGAGGGPEWARVEDDAIVVEPWPGGMPAPGGAAAGAARAGRRRARPA